MIINPRAPSHNLSSTTLAALEHPNIDDEVKAWATDPRNNDDQVRAWLREHYPEALGAAGMNAGLTMRWAMFDSRRDTVVKPRTGTWGEFRDLLTQAQVTHDKHARKLYAPVSYHPGATRGKDGVNEFYAAPLDFDHDIDLGKLLDSFPECELTLAHSFRSHPLRPRVRVTIPLAAPIPKEVWPTLWGALDYLADGKADEDANEIHQIFYLPSIPTSAAAWLAAHDPKKHQDELPWAEANAATWAPQHNHWQPGGVYTAAQWIEYAKSEGWDGAIRQQSRKTAAAPETVKPPLSRGCDAVDTVFDAGALPADHLATINTEAANTPRLSTESPLPTLDEVRDFAPYLTRQACEAYEKYWAPRGKKPREPNLKERPRWTNDLLIPFKWFAEHDPENALIIRKHFDTACEAFGGNTAENDDQWNRTKPDGERTIRTARAIAEMAGWRPAAALPAVSAGGAVVPTPTARVCDSELCLAERFAHENSGHLRWCPELACWLGWTGSGWNRLAKDAPEVHRRLKLMIRNAITEATARLEAREGGRRAVEALVKTLEGKRVLDNILDLATREEVLSVPLARLDQHPTLLRCQNAVVELSRGIAVPAEHDQFITQEAAVDFDPAATCPRWEQFIHEICQGDTAQMQIIQRIAGLSLSGLQWKGFALLYGPKGDNGKSTLAEVLRRMLGTYAISLPSTAVAVQTSTSNADRVKLRGARMAVVPEWDKGTAIDTAFVKSITGGDTVAARGTYAKHPIEFVSQATVWIVGNHRPNITESSDAMWNRTWSIPFEYVPPVKDSKLGDKLDAERSGILNWAIKGLQDFQREGMTRTAKMDEAQAEYRHTSDALGEWREANVVEVPDAWCTRAELQNDYRNFAAARGMKPMSAQSFVGALEERGFTTAKRVGIRGHRGLMLKDKTFTQ